MRLRTTVLVCLALVTLLAHPRGAAPVPDALPYSRGFLVTGNYVVGGVDLPKAGGPGTINVDGAYGNAVPSGSDIVAAYLYWETITASANPLGAATFRGAPIEAAKATTLSALPGTGANCWGAAGGSTATLTMFRADVLGHLPKQLDANGAWTGKHLVNDADLVANNLPLHTVTLPQEGTGNVLTQSAGATLLLVYRNPAEPLRKIVLYDGAYAQAQGTPTAQAINGIYKSAPDPFARLTHVVGSGAGNTGERLLVNGSVAALNPFAGPAEGSDRAWSNKTVGVSAAMPGTDAGNGFGETVTTRVDHGNRDQNSTPYECLSWAAIIFSTSVADVDHDGLPDGIEDAAAGLKDPATPAFPNGQPLPNLNQMGASSALKDLFVEMNAMWAPPGTTYGAAAAPYNAATNQVTDAAGHSHLPSPEVLKMVGDAYALNGIRPHFDVGSVEAYQAAPGHACAAGDPVCDASLYLVPTTHARGGEMILERACDPTGAITCQFPDYPGTVGWKFGVQLYKDAPVGDSGEELTGPQVQQWGLLTGAHRRRFDRPRVDFFHYVLYAHARGKAKSPLPCLDAQGQPSGYDISSPANACTTRNPLFHVPSSTSGIADLPGNTAMITLGLWDDFRGSTFVQASTTLHELGHNLNLWHGGAEAVWGNAAVATQVEPNCKPNYLSSMSYLFQAHGLMDAAGDVRIDYSRGAYAAVNEALASDGPVGPGALYLPSWFAPANSPLASILGTSQATRFCSGVTFTLGAEPAPMARVHASTPDGTIDWDGDGLTATSLSQDVNFDGTAGGTLTGHNDWANLRLDQKGAGRRMRIVSTASGDFLDFGSGDFLDFGSGDFLDFGSGDFLDFGAGTYYVNFASGDFLDFGSGDFLDFGSGDFLDFGSGILLPDAAGVVGASGDFLDFGSGDFLDFGSGDFLDFGSGDFLDFGSGDFLDFGSGDFLDFGAGDFLDFGAGAGGQELDFDLARAMGRTPPRKLAACVLGATCTGTQPSPGSAQYHRTSLQWKAPTFGHVFTYRVYRVTGSTVTAASDRVLVGTTASTSLVDLEELPNGVAFTYVVTAEFDDVTPHAVSGASNFVVITAVNDAPAAAADGYGTNQDTPLTVVPASGLLANDADVDSAPASLRVALPVVSGPSHGALSLAADGSFTYTPNAGFFGTDTFTYRANDGAWPRDPSVQLSADSNLATATITVGQIVTPPSNTAPVCAALNTTVVTGGSVALSHTCTDADGDALTLTAVGTATLGTTTRTGNSFTYAVASPKVGADTFTFTVTDGTVATTGTVAVRVIYGFTNVENLPPRNGRLFSPGSVTPFKWRWTNIGGVTLDSSAAQPVVTAYACSTGGKLPPAYLMGPFTPTQPGSGNSFVMATKKNSFTWQFNWKLTYTVTDATGTTTLNLPAGTYVVAISSAVTGQTDPAGSHACDGGRTLTGALIVLQ